MLIKFLTFVSIASVPGMAFAVDRPQYVSNQDAQVTLYNENCRGRSDQTLPDNKCTELLDTIVRGSNSSSNGGCSVASEELNDAQGAFMAACSNMGLPRGIPECAQAVDKCRSQSKKEKKAYCPGAPDSERAEKQLEKSEDRLDKLKEKIPELQEKVTEGASESNNKIAELRQKGRDALAETTKAIRQAGRDKEDKQSKIVEQLSQLSSQILQIDEQIGQLELSKSDAEMKREETKTQIDLNCHQSASATVSKLQSDALARMQSGTYSRGGQAALLKNVGMSDRESWQRVAQKYYNWCLQSQPTIASKNSANRMYTQAVKATDVAIANAKKRKALLEAQANRMKDPTGACGSTAPAADGSTGESDTCRANRQAAEDMQQLRDEYAQKLQGLNEDIARTQRDGAQKLMAQQQALGNAQRDLNDEKTRVANLRSALDGDAFSKEDTGEFKKAYAKWASAAAKANACCASKKSVPKDVCDRNDKYLEAAGFQPYQQNEPEDRAPQIQAAEPQVEVEPESTRTPATPRGRANSGATQRQSGSPVTPGGDPGNTSTGSSR